jgi:hypothetical protein
MTLNFIACLDESEEVGEGEGEAPAVYTFSVDVHYTSSKVSRYLLINYKQRKKYR